jgi:hypothetical protein
MANLAELERLLRAGRIGRREFLARASMLGAASLVVPSLMSGSAHAAGPKKGGHFRVGLGHGSTTDTLDPATFENGYTQVLGYEQHRGDRPGYRRELGGLGRRGDLELQDSRWHRVSQWQDRHRR